MTREIVLDTETTGLTPDPGGKADRLVEIGCVELLDGKLTENNFQCYINPGRPMPEEAQKVHGLSDEFLADKPPFDEIVTEFLEFIGDAKLVIHNAEFDMGFINAELQFSGRPPLPMERAFDTLALARTKYPNMGNRLDDLCKRLNVDNSTRVLHGALVDADLLAQVYIRMTSGEQHGLTLAQTAKTIEVESYDTASRSGLVVSASETELKTHRAFLSKIEKPLWSE